MTQNELKNKIEGFNRKPDKAFQDQFGIYETWNQPEGDYKRMINMDSNGNQSFIAYDFLDWLCSDATDVIETQQRIIEDYQNKIESLLAKITEIKETPDVGFTMTQEENAGWRLACSYILGYTKGTFNI